MDLPEPDALVQEQIDYYRARAPEYDDWWERRGRYELEPGALDTWDSAKRGLEEALANFAPAGDVLEVAAGTGNLTRMLLRHDAVSSLTALDSSEETLAVNRRKVGGDQRITHEVHDVFTWRPARTFDVVAFGFWLSHVPPNRFAQFWQLVDDALAPNGRVFFADNTVGRGEGWGPWNETWLDHGVSLRTLADGRKFHIVKRLWTPDEIVAELAALGWTFRAREHDGKFLTADGARS